jgi:hypothetical protein
MKLHFLAFLAFLPATRAVDATQAVDFDPGDDQFGTDDLMVYLTLGMDILNECEVDFEGMMNANADMMTSLATGGENLDYDSVIQTIQEYALQCTDGQATRFENALDGFRTCSSIDLRTVLESFADALVGSTLQCALAMAPLMDQMENADLAIPEICVESFLGQNPVGDLLRSILLYPDRLVPCFSSLSKAIPECTLEEWPIPLIGKIMKKTMCVLGSAQEILNEFAEVEIEAIAECLGDSMACTQLDVCIESGVISLALPPPLRGAPLSDAVLRVAEETGQQDAVEAYNSFVSKCIPDTWLGWTYEVGVYVKEEPSRPELTAPENPNFVREPPTKPMDASSASSAGPFMGGLAMGALVVGILWVFTLYRRKMREELYQSVEMVGADLSLA